MPGCSSSLGAITVAPEQKEDPNRGYWAVDMILRYTYYIIHTIYSSMWYKSCAVLPVLMLLYLLYSTDDGMNAQLSMDLLIHLPLIPPIAPTISPLDKDGPGTTACVNVGACYWLQHGQGCRSAMEPLDDLNDILTSPITILGYYYSCDYTGGRT